MCDNGGTKPVLVLDLRDGAAGTAAEECVRAHVVAQKVLSCDLRNRTVRDRIPDTMAIQFVHTVVRNPQEVGKEIFSGAVERRFEHQIGAKFVLLFQNAETAEMQRRNQVESELWLALQAGGSASRLHVIAEVSATALGVRVLYRGDNGGIGRHHYLLRRSGCAIFPKCENHRECSRPLIGQAAVRAGASQIGNQKK